MTTIRLNGRTVATSRNLRGALAYGSKHGVGRVLIAPASGNRGDSRAHNSGGLLLVQYLNGALCQTSFASYTVLIDWTARRRSWPKAERATEGQIIAAMPAAKD